MGTRFWSVVFDAHDHVALARFWSDALGWPSEQTEEDTSYVRSEDKRVPRLEFVPSSEPKVAKNRLHLDLSTTSDDHYDATVERLLGLGARHADIGQGDITWTVLADPEGNELCVLRPDQGLRTSRTDRDDLSRCGRRRDDGRTSGRAATGLDDHAAGRRRRPRTRGIGPDARDGTEGRAEARRRTGCTSTSLRRSAAIRGPRSSGCIAAGAPHVDIGQGDVPWVVLADPRATSSAS